MAKTLLAVDDSVTMRKVLEITFSGEDFRVITAENAQGALGMLGENPGVFVVDTVLGGEDGYALAKELRRRSPGAAIIMLASRYAPYDQARGRDAGADDWADKPFDTQQLIDKLRKVVLAKEAGGAQPSLAPAPPASQVAPQGAPYRAPAPPQAPPSQNMGGSGGLGRGTQQSLGDAAQAAQSARSAQGVRTGTLVFGEPPPMVSAHAAPAPAPRPAAYAPPAAAAPPSPMAASPMASTRGSGAGAIGAAVNGHLADKLGELGLSPQQAEAVLALSRDVVERVVWEVVPQLAETMIKEEIQRLMHA